MQTFLVVPDDPLPLARTWVDEASASGVYNPGAMALATVGADGRPSCRYVLLKGFDAEQGYVVFYTNYGSRKAAELDATGRAAAALYWPNARRQLRLEGPVTRSPADESDEYFGTRPRQSQLNAWASAQSLPLPAAGLEPALAALESRFPAERGVPRPEGWGGYRLRLERVEFWVEGAGRFHERVQYLRELAVDADGEWINGDWRHVRLQP